MTIEKMSGIAGDGYVHESGGNKRSQNLQSKLNMIKQPPKGGTAQRKVTQKVMNSALKEPNSHKALKLLLASSPVGFGQQSAATELENLGYTDTGMRQMHLGAPIEYLSSDGGKVTVYNQGFIDKDGNYTTDAGPRTTIYKNENFEQTMIYDKNGKLTGGKVVIKDKVGGFTERQIDFTVTQDGKIATTE